MSRTEFRRWRSVVSVAAVAVALTAAGPLPAALVVETARVAVRGQQSGPTSRGRDRRAH